MRWQNEDEILAFARLLEGKSIDECPSPYCLPDVKEHGGKGGFGQYVENAYFGLETNNLPIPDFHPVKLELKVSSLEWKKREHRYEPKERISLGLIDYMEVGNEKSFEESHVYSKNAALLIVWYIYNSSDHFGGYKITLADIWRCLDEDGVQIKKDWDYIVGKIRAGKAHEISEGDTLFLGASTKGSSTVYRPQPFSDIEAKQRSFCFKLSYVNSIYRRMLDRKKKREEHSEWFAKPDQSIEEAFKERFVPYIGKSTEYLKERFNISDTEKSRLSRICHAIIGTKNITSFEPYRDLMAGGVQFKTVRLGKNGKPRESMSFPYIRYCELGEEEWETSSLYQTLTSKFIIPVFVKAKKADDEYILDRLCVWNMPEADLEKVHHIWERVRAQVLAGDYGNFVKESDDMIVHIRPHGRGSWDLADTPQGIKVERKSFWLNRKYVMENILSKPIIAAAGSEIEADGFSRL